MLKYIWTVTQDLFLAVTFASLIHAVVSRMYGRSGKKIHWAGIIVGNIASLILAVVKNTTNKIISSHWNHYIYLFIIGFTLLFFVLSLILGRKEHSAGVNAAGIVFCAAGAGISAVWIFYSLPGAVLYLVNFNTMGNGYLSWYYFQRLIGWLIALLMLAVYARLLYLCALQIKNLSLPLAVLNVGTMVNAVYCFGRFFVPWVNRAKWLGWSVKYTDEKFGWIGNLMMFTAKYSMWFIWIAAAGAAVLTVVFFAGNIRVTEPYDNSAQHRKLKARNRTHRRQAVGAAVFLAAAVVSMSIIKSYDTRVIALSEPETYTVEGDSLYIPMELVNDGHLHRFEYTTKNGVNVRWIVVKKPNSATYGVGYDACEVCGSAGYFERNGQIVCKRCDVVMNINTIGFKGGCNPIPLSYEVNGGNLVFAIEDIEAGEREFK